MQTCMYNVYTIYMYVQCTCIIHVYMHCICIYMCTNYIIFCMCACLYTGTPMSDYVMFVPSLGFMPPPSPLTRMWRNQSCIRSTIEPHNNVHVHVHVHVYKTMCMYLSIILIFLSLYTTYQYNMLYGGNKKLLIGMQMYTCIYARIFC